MEKIKVFSIAYISIGVLFVLTLFFHPYPGSYLIKPIPVLIMTYLCFLGLKGGIRYLMVAALLFSAAGDVLLDVDRGRLFVPGLVSFLVAQVLYSIVFAKEFRFRAARLLIAAGMIIYVSVIYYLEDLGRLQIPVLIYMVVITVMGIFASFSKRPVNGVLVGALFFIVSDSLIAINKFIHPFPYSTIFVIITYYSAQYRIGMGMLGAKD